MKTLNERQCAQNRHQNVGLSGGKLDGSSPLFSPPFSPSRSLTRSAGNEEEEEDGLDHRVYELSVRDPGVSTQSGGGQRRGGASGPPHHQPSAPALPRTRFPQAAAQPSGTIHGFVANERCWGARTQLITQRRGSHQVVKRLRWIGRGFWGDRAAYGGRLEC